MYTVDLKIILDNRTFPEAGDALYQQIAGKINSEDKIILNMDGVEMLPSMFLNVSIGRIIEEMGAEKLKKIAFAKITKIQTERIKDYIARFKASSLEMAN